MSTDSSLSPTVYTKLQPQDKGMDLVKGALASQGGLGATASGAPNASKSGSKGGSEGSEGESAASYLEAHPEVRAVLNDFVSAVLLEKPEVRV